MWFCVEYSHSPLHWAWLVEPVPSVVLVTGQGLQMNWASSSW